MQFSKFLTGVGAVGYLVGASVLLAAPASKGYPLDQKGEINQEFNVTWSANADKKHVGIDISVRRAGIDVYAIKPGTVENQGKLGSAQIMIRGRWVNVNWGHYLVIKNEDGTSSGYLHINLQKSYVPGARIKAGDKIGVIFDNEVPHLHLNQCSQVKGCQHGAWPNDTYSKSAGALTKYYSRPSI